MGESATPTMTYELDVSFMYACGHGSAMAITDEPGHASASFMQVMASWPSA